MAQENAAAPQPRPDDTPAGDEIHMIRPHLRDIPPVPFPAGYGVRPMNAAEGSLWVDIERDAEEYLTITDDMFDREFGKDLAAVPERCFLITSPDAAAVGTTSAWYHTHRDQQYGLIHWVAVRRAFQGRGLGKAAVAFALGKLAQWHDRAMLGTQTRRIPAIGLYLSLGFQPDLPDARAVERWRKVAAHIDHPALAELATCP